MKNENEMLELITFAEGIDTLRIAASKHDSTQWEVYNDLSNALQKTLGIILGTDSERPEFAYQAIHDGSSVKQALDIAVREVELPSRPEPCNCEHSAHFPNEGFDKENIEAVIARVEPLPFIHEYMAVPAGEQRAMYVGPICDECAKLHMADYLEK